MDVNQIFTGFVNFEFQSKTFHMIMNGREFQGYFKGGRTKKIGMGWTKLIDPTIEVLLASKFSCQTNPYKKTEKRLSPI